jgi:hypothetical protein
MARGDLGKEDIFRLKKGHFASPSNKEYKCNDTWTYGRFATMDGNLSCFTNVLKDCMHFSSIAKLMARWGLVSLWLRIACNPASFLEPEPHTANVSETYNVVVIKFKPMTFPITVFSQQIIDMYNTHIR